MNVDPRLLGRVWDLLRARDSRPRPQGSRTPTLSIVDYADGPSELMLYEEIGMWGITAQDVVDQLAGRRGDLHVRINSRGGDVFDGYAIYNALITHDGQVTVTVEGVAASAASFIAMAGDTIRCCLASQMMIHDASGLCMGTEDETREWADVLGSISNTIAAVYAERAGGQAEEWRAVMRAEKWYTPEEAVAAGLADEVITPARQPRPPAPAPDEPGEDPAEQPGMRTAPAIAATAAPTPTPEPEPAPVVEPAARCTATPDGQACTQPPLADTDTCRVHTPPTAQPAPTPDPDTAVAGDTAAADSSWAASVAHLLTPAPSTVDELLNALVQKGKAR